MKLPCPSCGYKRELTSEHHALGEICDVCARALSWDGQCGWRLVSGVMPGAYLQGSSLRTRRGSNRAA